MEFFRETIAGDDNNLINCDEKYKKNSTPPLVQGNHIPVRIAEGHSIAVVAEQGFIPVLVEVRSGRSPMADIDRVGRLGSYYDVAECV